MTMCLMIILIELSKTQCLTCNEVLDMSPTKQLALEELKTMSLKDINDCLQHIAREPMRIADADFVWKSLIAYYEGISNIPEDILEKLHWVTVAITSEEYTNITIASIDTVRNFGKPYNLDKTQLEAIADRVRQDFAGKLPEDYTYYDLVALNQILCAFNRSEIERIHPAAYREAAMFIGKIKNCQPEALIGFANLATHEDAFGSFEKWTGLTLKTVGNVADYLDIPKELKKKLETEKQKIGDKQDFLLEFKMYVESIHEQ